MFDVNEALSHARTSLSQRKLKLAQKQLTTILREVPDNVTAAYLLACLNLQTGHRVKANKTLRKLASVEPDKPAILNTLGVSLFMIGENLESEQILRRAAELAPQHHEIAGNLGLVLQHIGKRYDAYNFLSISISGEIVSEKIADAWFREALVTKNFDDIRNAHGRLSQVFPNNPFLLAWSVMEEENTEFIANQDHKWAKIGLHDSRSADMQLLRMWRALSIDEPEFAEKLLDSILKKFPCHAGALFALALGHLRHSSDTNLKESASRKITTALDNRKLDFTDRVLLRFAAGTVADMLGQHEMAFHHFGAANTDVWERLEIATDEYQALASDVCGRFSNTWFDTKKDIRNRSSVEHDRCGEGLIFVFGVPRSGTTLVEQILTRGGKVISGGERGDVDGLVNSILSDGGNGGDIQDALNNFSIRTARRIASNHHQIIDEITGGTGKFVDKTPRNFVHLGVLALMFPKATFVNCSRNPVDTCLSCYFNYFEWGSVPYSYNLECLGDYYRQYEQIVHHWRTSTPIEMCEVVYEELIEEPEETIRALVAGCGLEWDSSYLTIGTNKQAVGTASVVQVRQPLYKTSMERWKPYEKFISPLLNALETDYTPRE